MNKFLFQKSWIWLVVFFGFAVMAFWPSYYSKEPAESSLATHLHGIAMTLWCLMIIAQAYLVRSKHREIHSKVGKLSYILVPFLIISTLLLTHNSLQGSTPYTDIVYADLALMINGILLFGIFYGLAIYHRKDSLKHARYMFVTIFPMFTPITDRIIYRNFRPLVEAAPTIDGNPIVPFWGFLLALIIILVLTVWDWRSNNRKDVFPVVLGMLIAYHISVFTFHMIPAWQTFGTWFLSIS